MPGEDLIPAITKPHHEEIKHKWYLPEEKIHGAPVQELSPLKDDPRLLEELWYITKSDKGASQKASKPTKPTYHEFD